MTLKEMKVKTFSLIEEYYPEEKGLAEDEDVLNKINGVVNQIQLDLMKYRKIPTYKEINITKEDKKIINLREKIEDLYQLNRIYFDENYEKNIEYSYVNDLTIKIPDDYIGTIIVYYYKYPKKVEVLQENLNEEYDDNYVFDLDPILLEIMPYGIAADLLKMDMISSYGKYFYERYLEMKNNIDTRNTSGSIRFEGGVDV